MRYPRTPYLPWSPGGESGRLVIDPQDLANRKIVVTEKLDGQNTLLLNGKARTRSLHGQSAPWLAMVRKHHAWKTLEFPDVEFYGEDLYGVHAVEYWPVREEETFRLFAVRENGVWLSWDEVTRWGEKLEVRTVPLDLRSVLSESELREYTTLRTTGPSALGPEREGCVVRLADSFTDAYFARSIAKSVRPRHVQPDSEHWTRNWRPCRIIERMRA